MITSLKLSSIFAGFFGSYGIELSDEPTRLSIRLIAYARLLSGRRVPKPKAQHLCAAYYCDLGRFTDNLFYVRPSNRLAK